MALLSALAKTSIFIYPNDANVKTGHNHDKPAHIASRAKFYDDTSTALNVPGLTFERDANFDDPTGKMRSAGIKAIYSSFFSGDLSLKPGVILELGFDQTTPHTSCTITSWAFEKALSLEVPVIDNRATNISCYCPEYTFVEKLQTISTKYRLQQEKKTMPINFIRHYYDVYMLLENSRVISFIGTDEYKTHKERRFRAQDEIVISNNPAFLMEDLETKKLYSDEFKKKSAIYFGEQPSFDEIIERIHKNINQL